LSYTIDVKDLVPLDEPFLLNGKPHVLRCPHDRVVGRRRDGIISISKSAKFMKQLLSQGKSKAHGVWFYKADVEENMLFEGEYHQTANM